MKYGYIRVSTREQNETRQVEELKKHGLNELNLFTDKLTGKNFNRPNYQKLKENMKKSDELYIVSIDRLGRNKEQCLKELRELKEKGIIVRVLDIPTTLIKIDKNNLLMVEMINNILIEVYTTLAEEELNKIKKRQRQGIDSMVIDENTGKRVGKSGKVTGRPSKQDNLTVTQKTLINQWLDKSNKKYKLSNCLEDTGLSRSTLYRIKNNRKKEHSYE